MPIDDDASIEDDSIDDGTDGDYKDIPSNELDGSNMDNTPSTGEDIPDISIDDYTYENEPMDYDNPVDDTIYNDDHYMGNGNNPKGDIDANNQQIPDMDNLPDSVDRDNSPEDMQNTNPEYMNSNEPVDDNIPDEDDINTNNQQDLDTNNRLEDVNQDIPPEDTQNNLNRIRNPKFSPAIDNDVADDINMTDDADGYEDDRDNDSDITIDDEDDIDDFTSNNQNNPGEDVPDINNNPINGTDQNSNTLTNDNGNMANNDIPDTDDEDEDNIYNINDEHLQNRETSLFSNMTQSQINIMKSELLQNYVNMYDSVCLCFDNVNKIEKTFNNKQIINFISNELLKLKDYTNQIITNTFNTKTYFENKKMYEQCLLILKQIHLILQGLIRKKASSDKSK